MTNDLRELARQGLVYLNPEGALAQWIDRAAEALKELDWEYRGFNGDGAGLDEAMLDDGYTHLDTVYHLLADLIDHGGYYNEAGRVAAQQFVDVMVK